VLIKEQDMRPYRPNVQEQKRRYSVNFSRNPEPLPPNLRQSEGQPLVDYIITSAHKPCVRISSESFSPVSFNIDFFGIGEQETEVALVGGLKPSGRPAQPPRFPGERVALRFSCPFPG
jgi:hypothetical protein